VHLLQPPQAHSNIRFHDHLTIQVIRIVDRQITNNPTGDEDIGLKVIQQELDTLRVGPQSISLTVKSVELGDCDFCAAALTRGVATTTSTVLWRPPGPKTPHPQDNHTEVFNPSFQARVHQFLDSREMHAALSSQGPLHLGLWAEAGLDPPPPVSSPGPLGIRRRTLPVYLFDLSFQDALLFDRHYQVVPFPDMVLAVRTQAGETLLDYKCGGEVVLLQPHSVTRPLLGGILQAVWGVAPTSFSWDAPSQVIRKNHLWDPTLTPYGPASTASQLSFVQRDAAVRNLITSQLNATVSAAAYLLRTFADFGRGEAPLTTQAATQFTARWHVLQHKLARATRTAAVHNFNVSMYFALSAAHEVGALADILHASAQEMHSTIQCFEEAKKPLELYVGVLLVIGLVIYFFTRQQGTSKAKKY